MATLGPDHETLYESRSAISQFLFVSHPPQPVDLCFVLGCPTPTNMKPAIALYDAGLTPAIVIAGHGPSAQTVPESEIFRDYALERGVPRDVMLVETVSSNTRENFAFARPLIEERYGWDRIRRVALVAKPFHMRRALMTARRQWPAHLEFVCRPSDEPDDPPAATWWQTPSGRSFVLNELRAIGTYALQGDIGGF